MGLSYDVDELLVIFGSAILLHLAYAASRSGLNLPLQFNGHANLNRQICMVGLSYS